MPELRVVPFRAPEKKADETLLSALQQVTDLARSGTVERMLLVWTDEQNVAHSLAYRASDLTMIGALNVALSNLQSKWESS